MTINRIPASTVPVFGRQVTIATQGDPQDPTGYLGIVGELTHLFESGHLGFLMDQIGKDQLTITAQAIPTGFDSKVLLHFKNPKEGLESVQAVSEEQLKQPSLVDRLVKSVIRTLNKATRKELEEQLSCSLNNDPVRIETFQALAKKEGPQQRAYQATVASLQEHLKNAARLARQLNIKRANPWRDSLGKLNSEKSSDILKADLDERLTTYNELQARWVESLQCPGSVKNPPTDTDLDQLSREIIELRVLIKKVEAKLPKPVTH